MAKPRKKPAPAKEFDYPRSIETFQDPRWSLGRFESTAPSCFNGFVSIDRYRITVERIEEPVEVLRERLLKLWRETEYNSHLWHPMWDVAERIGMSREDLKPTEQGMHHPSCVQRRST